jgi:hypothetical protein
MRRSPAPPNSPGTFLAAQFSADYTTNMSGFDLRQAQPARFRNSKAVGAAFGLTPSKYQSGQINRTGAISKCGDEMMRVMLYEAAQIMLVRV